MPKLLSSRQVIKILENNGFVFISQKGSHLKFRKQETQSKTVIVPANKKEIPIGTLHSIIRQSSLSKENFEI
ncbi:type II toxin-antitoxin system HicA family toxin [Candidatus Nomurabacteria bacterium]|nr:type II toxin-antitoxin system HicA family toxin [Candidatus Nomurabacteria bacterium]